MSDPQTALQKAIVAAAMASPAVSALLGAGSEQRLFDRPPAAPDITYPFASFGGMQTVPEYDGCGRTDEVNVQIDVWSREPGYVECRAIASALVDVLDARLIVDGHVVMIHRLVSMNTVRERDDRTSRAILRLRYSLRPAA